MAEEDHSPQSSTRPRRSSFAGQTLADLFGTGRTMPRNSVDVDNGSPPNQNGPIAQAAAQAQRRRQSLTTMGRSGDAAARFNPARGARSSLDSANSGSIDESAIEDDPGVPASAAESGTSFGRRMSFGARALRDVRGSGGGQVGQGQNGTRSPPASQNRTRAASGTISTRDVKGRGEGFDWSENLRTRAERTSIAGQGGGGGGPSSSTGTHLRAKSVAVMEPPVRPMPREPQRPDPFQERILKGDFYLD
nr:hypothetical protein CFP56_68162 [Quercus suber]